MANQTLEQKARDLIDKKLVEAGWAVQSKDGIDLNAACGVAIREYTSDTGPMDYMLMVDGKPCAARPDWLRACQIRAITKIEESFGQGRPSALVQMATGSGKTFKATFVRDKED